MSEVEKITFENYERRRRQEALNVWEQRAAAAARNAEKKRRVKSWTCFATYVCFMVFGSAASMCAVYAAMGLYTGLVISTCAAFISLIGAMFFSENVER